MPWTTKSHKARQEKYISSRVRGLVWPDVALQVGPDRSPVLDGVSGCVAIYAYITADSDELAVQAPPASIHQHSIHHQYK